MANTNINIRMDADLKRQFEAFCADMGMTMTTAFNVFARKAVRVSVCWLRPELHKPDAQDPFPVSSGMRTPGPCA